MRSARRLQGRLRHALLVLLCPLAFTVQPASGAETIFDNISNSADGRWNVTPNHWVAQQFSLGDLTGDIPIERITLRLYYETVSDLEPVIAIYSNNLLDNTPDALLRNDFTKQTSGTGLDVEIAFAPTTALQLTAGENFWVVLSANRFLWEWETLDWRSTGDNSGAGYPFTSKNALWNGSEWSPSPISPFLMKVESVPEPRTGLLVVAGVGLAARWMWRRRSRPV